MLHNTERRGAFGAFQIPGTCCICTKIVEVLSVDIPPVVITYFIELSPLIFSPFIDNYALRPSTFAGIKVLL